MNTCKNCIFWRKRLSEPDMGLCFKANGNGDVRPSISNVEPLKKGIAIRIIDGGKVPKLDVFFGKDFGCIYFKNSF